jgi:hypothetical protein
VEALISNFNMNSKIYKVGIEIEGEFSRGFEMRLQEVGVMKGDGSVRRCAGRRCGLNLIAAEFNSRAISVRNIGKMMEIFDMFQQAYENEEFHYNKTCGFHIHLSFLPKTPAEIFSIQFVNGFFERMKEKFVRAFAVRSKNHFCSTNIQERDIAWKDSERYRGVNLWPSMYKHGTIEFRIWPSDKPEKMREYFLFTIGFVKKFLSAPLKVDFSDEVNIDTEYSEQSFEVEVDCKEVNINE